MYSNTANRIDITFILFSHIWNRSERTYICIPTLRMELMYVSKIEKGHEIEERDGNDKWNNELEESDHEGQESKGRVRESKLEERLHSREKSSANYSFVRHEN